MAMKTESRNGTRMSSADRMPATIMTKQAVPTSALVPVEKLCCDCMFSPAFVLDDKKNFLSEIKELGKEVYEMS